VKTSPPTDAMSVVALDTNVLAEIQASNLSFASISLIIYDHLITLGQEVTWFWSGSWTLSRILYLSIRYLSLCQACISLFSHFIAINPSGMDQIYRATFSLTFIVIVLCQAVITLRVWYLFPRSRVIRYVAVTTYLACAAVTLSLAGYYCGAIESFVDTLSIESDLALQMHPPLVWQVYVPSLFIHSFLFSLKIYRVVTCSDSLGNMPLLQRFLKEWVQRVYILNITDSYTLQSGAD